ncbi:MAG TPA: hypothetical protein VM580_32030 [Labilithrix sp.]|nr:hypothetical protein [Labilithrix sp.]
MTPALATLHAFSGIADAALAGVCSSDLCVHALVLQTASGATGFDRGEIGEVGLLALGEPLILLRARTGSGEPLARGSAVGSVRVEAEPRAWIFGAPSAALDAELAALAEWKRASARVALARRFGRERPEPLPPLLAELLDAEPGAEAVRRALDLAPALLAVRFGGAWGLYAHLFSLDRRDWLAARGPEIAVLGIDVRCAADLRALPEW